MLKHSLRTIAVLLLALSASACLERKEIGMLNPDGSGKIVIDTLVTAPPGMGDKGKPDIAAVGKQFATILLTKTTGVDAWKDIVVETSPDGRAHVAATAYFPDISKLHLDIDLPMQWKKDAAGNYMLTIERSPNPPTAQATTAPTDAELAGKMKTARANYQANLPVLRGILSTLQINMSLTLPGTVTATNIFTPTPATNTIALHIDGKKMLDTLGEIMADDKTLEESLRASPTPGVSGDLLVTKMFGKAGPPSATVHGPLKPLFDYASEMHAAKATEIQALSKAGIDRSATPQVTPDPAAK